MVLREVLLRRFVELSLGIADEHRPTLAMGDPSVLFELCAIAPVTTASRSITSDTDSELRAAPGLHIVKARK